MGATRWGRSVTDLEIDLGVLSDSEQQPRSLFYFREPLPCADMPAPTAALYSDAYSTNSAAADSAAHWRSSTSSCAVYALMGFKQGGLE
jgi:hypothetical protein